MKRNGIALALLLCLLLTACGGEEDSRGQTSFLGQAAEMEETAGLLTVDGREVPAWRYLYWLADTCDQICERYETAGVPLEWDMPMNGGTLVDYAREQALADTVLYATVENWAERYGCGLVDEDLAELDRIWAEQTASQGGEEVWLEELADLGLDRVRAEELAGVGMMYGKLCALALEEDGVLSAEPEKLAVFAQEQGYLTVEQILFPAGADKEAARAQAEEAFAKLNGAENQSAAFQALTEVAGEKRGPYTFLPGEDFLEASLEKAAAALEPGQCSGILECGDGFAILRRLPVDGAFLAAEYFDCRLQHSAEEAEITTASLYEKLNVKAFYQALLDIRNDEKEK